MPAIGVVDDRKDQRDLLVGQIRLHLRNHAEWEAFETPPLEDINNYPSWISENEISVLILDERLHEATDEQIPTEDTSLPVEYAGHNVVDLLRGRYPTLPIWIVTAYADDPELQRRCSEVESVLPRNDFSLNPGTYVSRFVRVGTKFYQENREELERLAELSRKIARGVATDEEIREVGGLQLSQSLPFHPLQLRSDWITKMEQAVDELADLEKRIREHLEGKQG